MVSDGGSRGFLLIFFNAAVKSLVVAVMMSVSVAVGMINFWGKQEIVFPIKTELVTVIQILWQQ